MHAGSTARQRPVATAPLAGAQGWTEPGGWGVHGRDRAAARRMRWLRDRSEVSATRQQWAQVPLSTGKVRVPSPYRFAQNQARGSRGGALSPLHVSLPCMVAAVHRHRCPLSPLSIVIAMHQHRCASSPLSVVTAVRCHHCPSSPLTIVTTVHRHRRASSLPCIVTAVHIAATAQLMYLLHLQDCKRCLTYLKRIISKNG